ncbi:rhodanese-like domain-containing protein [Candidatus Chrysopegis kryptomonas]|uniref:Rhodanese-related sulfurtransferase n=1 Tax=Candidatus Chryseopegocella kryptomonas TaxID=1633643 RepID=A0A0P1NV23_9BACT|nr:rhodanese-like domain-containing protein [Candidatus Chrysopegis kryptomonas]CUT02710.1 Rhodanese-related sulfurtransferase [Candidatus Chrysopegis kryptomonas]
MKNFHLKIFLLVLFLFGCGIQKFQNQEKTYVDITPVQAFEKLKKDKNVLLLDVRTREEFGAEHINGALNIPVQELENRLGELGKYKNFEIVVYCRSGNRSKRASEILVKNGFKKVYNLVGGIIEWKNKLGLKMKKITKDITIEDLVTEFPESVGFLMKKGIKCIVCGEPIWGTLEQAIKEKGKEDEMEQIIDELNEVLGLKEKENEAK